MTTQDPCSTPTGFTQNLGYPPRMAFSPPTAWLQSDYTKVLKGSRRTPPPSPAPWSHPPCFPSSFPLSLRSLFSFYQTPWGAVLHHLVTG